MDHYFVVNEDTLCATSGHEAPPALYLSCNHPCFTSMTVLAVIDDSPHQAGDVFAMKHTDTIRLASLDDTTDQFKIGQFRVDDVVSAALAKQDKETVITDDMLQHSLAVLYERMRLRLTQLEQAIAVDCSNLVTFADGFIVSYTADKNFNAMFLPRIDEIIHMVGKMHEPTDSKMNVVRLGETLKSEIVAFHMTPLSKSLPPVRDELLARYALCQHVSAANDNPSQTLLVAEKTLLDIHAIAYSMHRNMGELSSARIELEAREAITAQCLSDLELGAYDFSVLEQMITQKGGTPLTREFKIPWHQLNKSLSGLRAFTLTAQKALMLYQQMADETKLLPVPERKAILH